MSNKENWILYTKSNKHGALSHDGLPKKTQVQKTSFQSVWPIAHLCSPPLAASTGSHLSPETLFAMASQQWNNFFWWCCLQLELPWFGKNALCDFEWRYHIQYFLIIDCIKDKHRYRESTCFFVDYCFKALAFVLILVFWNVTDSSDCTLNESTVNLQNLQNNLQNK